MISSIHRPTQAVIDLEAIGHNIAAVKEHIPSETFVYAVVKANAYGHGAVAVARSVEDQVDGFCVSNIDEAVELRQAGITKEILVLGVVMPNQLGYAKEYDIVLTIASLDWYALAEREGMSLDGLRCHIKIDSGMGRIGVRTSVDANQLISSLKAAGALVEGAFTHFATADEADTQHFEEQLATFKQIVSELSDCPKRVHASNSATSLWHSETIFSAVRLGIVIYGLNPSGRELTLPYRLKPALELTSSIIHVKELEANAAVGYGATYRSQEKEVIATIPIGYADGWTRDMQGFEVLVDGQRCEIVGRVSMDQLTIRLPKAYPLGTPVTLIGRNGSEEITATDVADKRQTINYEVLCLLSDRIPRFYKGENHAK